MVKHGAFINHSFRVFLQDFKYDVVHISLQWIARVRSPYPFDFLEL